MPHGADQGRADLDRVSERPDLGAITTVSSAFSAVVAMKPELTAVDDGTEALSYRDLFVRANQLAHATLDRIPDPRTPVVLLCGHGVAPALSIMAMLHGGVLGAPIDAREPPARLRSLVAASRATHIVTDAAHAELAGALVDPRNVILHEHTLGQPGTAPDVRVDEDTPAFVMFTSGSTGAPKGVLVAHADIVPQAAFARSEDLMRPGDHMALTTSYGFALAQGRLVHALLNHTTTYTYDLRTRGVLGFAPWVDRAGITVCSIAPSTIRTLADAERVVRMESIRRASIGGETVTWRDVRRTRRLFAPSARLRNTFGSTEAGVVAWFPLPAEDRDDDGPLPIGRLDTGVELRLVDDDGREVPEGEPGRMVVLRSDRGMALGYWNDPELTAAHFFTAPDGRRGFRSADLARWRPDGLLDHVQRADSRVKVRGAMVATSAIEQSLIAMPDVADAAVVARRDDDGGTRLVAYVVARPRATLSGWRLRRDLASRVPSTHVPGTFVVLDELPRTVRHKLDRSALPPPPVGARTPYRAPTAAEAELAAVFAAVLGVERVGADDDFFELGGDSLAAVELIAAIEDRFGVEITTATVLDAPTVGRLAPRLGRRRAREAPVVVPLTPAPAAGAPALFCVTGGGAPALSLRALAAALPGRAVYGIQPRGLEERARPDATVEGIAGRALQGMRAVQPTGPYAVTGFSFGALVAFELACRLEHDGLDSGVLVILNGVSPIAPQHRRRRSARALARHGMLLTAGWLPKPGLEQYDRFLELSGFISRRYVPARAYGGRVVVIRTRHPEFTEGQGRVAHDDLGWGRVCTSPVHVVDVPGEHLGMLRPPVVERVGALIDAELRAAAMGIERPPDPPVL